MAVYRDQPGITIGSTSVASGSKASKSKEALWHGFGGDEDDEDEGTSSSTEEELGKYIIAGRVSKDTDIIQFWVVSDGSAHWQPRPHMLIYMCRIIRRTIRPSSRWLWTICLSRPRLFRVSGSFPPEKKL